MTLALVWLAAIQAARARPEPKTHFLEELDSVLLVFGQRNPLTFRILPPTVIRSLCSARTAF